LHPPDALAVVSHVANDELMAAWAWQATSVLSDAQLNTTAGAAVMVKAALTDPDPHWSVTL
jgi:methylglyoxal synthase